MNKSKLYIILLSIIAVLAIIFIYQSIPSMDELAVTDNIDNTNINTDIDDGVDIEARYSNKIVYSTNNDLDVEDLKEDCRDRNGTFNECGSACGPEADTCIELCTYTCEFDREETVEKTDVSELDFNYYYNKNLQVAFNYLPSMNIENNQDASISFVHLGPTQELGTEVYDGIIFTVNKIDNENNLSLREYTEERLNSNEIATVTKDISSYKLKDYSGYSYSLYSAGVERTYIFLPHKDNTILELRYSVSDPGDNNYQEIIDYMLDSVVIYRDND